MVRMDAVNDEPLTPQTRGHMTSVRNALLHLHKLLLDDERRAYERANGRVSPNELLQLLMSDSPFAWLRTVSGLVVRIDEMMSPKAGAGESEGRRLLQYVQETMMPSETALGFGAKYHDAIQREPDILLAHRDVRKLLSESL